MVPSPHLDPPTYLWALHAAVAGKKFTTKALGNTVSFVLAHELGWIKLKVIYDENLSDVQLGILHLQNSHLGGVVIYGSIQITFNQIEIQYAGIASGSLRVEID